MIRRPPRSTQSRSSAASDVYKRQVHVPPDADAGRAYELLAPAAVDGVLATLGGIAAGTLLWREQEGAATYAAKITAQDKLIDWARPATAIVAQVRAFSPYIGAVTDLLGKRTVSYTHLRAHETRHDL